MRVSVLIGSRNRPEVLLRSLESVLVQDYPDLEVLVLDDASDRVNLCQVLADRIKDSRLRCVRSDVQLGVAGGRNRLMEEATGEILCVIDDDAYFESANAIAHLVKVFSRDEGIGVVAPKVVDHHSSGARLLVPFPRFWLRRDPYMAEKGQYISYYLGGCHAIRRRVLEDCGMYASDLMFGEEELDLSYRVISSGYRIYYEPSVVVHHHPQASVVGTIRKGKVPSELYYHVRNRLYLAYRYLPARYMLTYLPFWLGYYFLKAVREGELAAFFAGLVDGITRLKKYPRTPINLQTQHYLKKHYGRLWW